MEKNGSKTGIIVRQMQCTAGTANFDSRLDLFFYFSHTSFPFLFCGFHALVQSPGSNFTEVGLQISGQKFSVASADARFASLELIVQGSSTSSLASWFGHGNQQTDSVFVGLSKNENPQRGCKEV